MGGWRRDMPSFKLNWFLKESLGEFWLQGMCENGGEQKITQSSFPLGLTSEALKTQLLLKCDRWHVALPLRNVVTTHPEQVSTVLYHLRYLKQKTENGFKCCFKGFCQRMH